MFITVNGNKYPAKDFNFNTICGLEEMGVDLDNVKTTVLVRAYVAICMGTDKDTAGVEIGNHIANGGDIAEIASIIQEKMGEDTSFFRQAEKRATENAQKSKGKKKQEEE